MSGENVGPPLSDPRQNEHWIRKQRKLRQKNEFSIWAFVKSDDAAVRHYSKSCFFCYSCQTLTPVSSAAHWTFIANKSHCLFKQTLFKTSDIKAKFKWAGPAELLKSQRKLLELFALFLGPTPRVRKLLENRSGRMFGKFWCLIGRIFQLSDRKSPK